MEESRMFEVPVWVDDAQKWLSGLSKRTTCDDIIYAILYNQNRHETDSTDAYAIFERWKGVEKALQGRTKILRVWRNWGSEQANVQFVMRRIDDIVASGEYLVTKRRYKRWRHRRRHEHCLRQQGGGDCQERCCECRAQNQDHHHHAGRHGKGSGLTRYGDSLDHDKLRHLQKLIRTVMAQEKKINTMANRLDETEILIEKYEAKIHFHRTLKKGVNYVQRSLLQDSTSTSEDSLEDFICKANIDLLEEYAETADRLIDVWESLINKEATIDHLVSLIKEHGIEPCTSLPEYDQHLNREKGDDNIRAEPSEQSWTAPWDVSSVCVGDEATDPEVEAVNTEFNRVMTLSVIQNITSEQLEREMIKYERQIDEKARLIAGLENDLRLTDHGQSLAKPALESDNGPRLESDSTDPVRYGPQATVADKDVGDKATDPRETSSSMETCLLARTSGTGSSAGKEVINDKESGNESERNGYHGHQVDGSQLTVHSSLDKNITSIDNTTDNNSTTTNTSNSNTNNNNNNNSNNNNNTKQSKQSLSHCNGPRIGLIGGALRTDFNRTKSKRDWLTVSPSNDKINSQEKITLNRDLSQVDVSTPVSDTDRITPKDAGNHRQNQPPDEPADRVNQCQYPVSSKERDLAASSRLAPSLLTSSQLFLAPENTSGAPCAIFKLDKSDDTDSTSDTGLGSMNSEEFNNSPMETLV